MPGKSWQQKLADDKDLPKIFLLTGKAKAKWGSGTMVIPAPHEVDAVMRGVPRGKLITIDEIHETLAKKRRHRLLPNCPLTSSRS